MGAKIPTRISYLLLYSNSIIFWSTDENPEASVPMDFADTLQGIEEEEEKQDKSPNWRTLEAEWDDQVADEDFWTADKTTEHTIESTDRWLKKDTFRVDFGSCGDVGKRQNETESITNCKKFPLNIPIIEKTEDRTDDGMNCDHDMKNNESKHDNISVKNQSRTDIEMTCIHDEEHLKLSDDVEKWSDDTDGDRLVIGDIGSRKKQRKLKSRFIPVRKKDPYPLNEMLLLTLEEASTQCMYNKHKH